MADVRSINTGLKGPKMRDLLESVIGQWSDGMYENNPQMAKYWRFADVDEVGRDVILEISTRDATKDYGRHWVNNGFYGLSDDKVKEIFARYIKIIVKQEIDDGLGGEWKRDCEEKCDYLTRKEPITVADAYYAYEMLKGRNVAKHAEYAGKHERKTLEESYIAVKDGKEYQLELAIEGEDPKSPSKLYVTVNATSETAEVNATDDREKDVKKALKQIGYTLKGEEKSESFSDGAWVVEYKDHGEVKHHKFTAVASAMSDYDELDGSGKYEYVMPPEWCSADELPSEESKKCESDGWDMEDAGIDGLEEAFDNVESLMYEMRNCVRGSNTGCKDWASLGQWIKNNVVDYFDQAANTMIEYSDKLPPFEE